MACERELEAAAERRTVDRGDNRLAESLDRAVNVIRVDIDRFAGGELLDVGPGDEGAPGTPQHDAGYRRIAAQPCERLQQTLAHGARQRIDGRIIDDNNGDGAVVQARDHFTHIVPEVQNHSSRISSGTALSPASRRRSVAATGNSQSKK